MTIDRRFLKFPGINKLNDFAKQPRKANTEQFRAINVHQRNALPVTKHTHITKLSKSNSAFPARKPNRYLKFSAALSRLSVGEKARGREKTSKSKFPPRYRRALYVCVCAPSARNPITAGQLLAPRQFLRGKTPPNTAEARERERGRERKFRRT